MSRKQDVMAYPPPRAMKTDRAAAYLDMSRSKFLELVERKDGMRMWDRLALDAASSEFQESGEGDTLARRNTFDDMLRA